MMYEECGLWFPGFKVDFKFLLRGLSLRVFKFEEIIEPFLV